MVHAKTFLLIILISFAGCKSKNGATQSDSDSQPIVTSVAVPEQPSETPDTVNEVPAPTPNKQDSSQLYRLTVSFISTGAGIDYKTAESFEKWLKEHRFHPKYVKTHWGREGETNYCLKLNELSTSEHAGFIQEVRTMLGNKELIFISEWTVCKGTPE